jgi:hypothetical protein
MQVIWQADDWLMIRDIRGRIDYPPVAYRTVAKAADILYGQDLLVRRLGSRAGTPGPAAWWCRAARPLNEHIRELIAQLIPSRAPDVSGLATAAFQCGRRRA